MKSLASRELPEIPPLSRGLRKSAMLIAVWDKPFREFTTSSRRPQSSYSECDQSTGNFGSLARQSGTQNAPAGRDRRQDVHNEAWT